MSRPLQPHDGPPLGPFLTRTPIKRQIVKIIHNEGALDEEIREAWAHIQESSGYFDTGTSIFEGDIVVIDQSRGGTERRLASRVDVNVSGGRHLSHIKVRWAEAGPPPVAVARNIALEDLHPAVLEAAGDLYLAGSFEQAVHAAFEAVEVRMGESTTADRLGAAMMLGSVVFGALGGALAERFQTTTSTDLRGSLEALEYLVLASLLHRGLDSSTG